MNNLAVRKLKRASQRVEEIKKFYKHVAAYILINLFLAFIWNFSFKLVGDFILSNQFDGGDHKYLPIWFIWGVFLTLHGVKTFAFPNLFNKDWEERKVKEYMNKKDLN
jgi:hypothetical protein